MHRVSSEGMNPIKVYVWSSEISTGNILEIELIQRTGNMSSHKVLKVSQTESLGPQDTLCTLIRMHITLCLDSKQA